MQTVTISESGTALHAQDEHQLVGVLAAAAREAASCGKLNIISLAAPNENTLSLAVGGSETALTFSYGHLHPPYYASLIDLISPGYLCAFDFDPL